MWTPLPTAGAPSPRFDDSAVWTGAEMLIWGGYVLGDGAGYNPATNTWRPLPAAGAPSRRYGHTAVWTGREMLVWGGEGPSGPLNDGAAYNPATNTWRPLPATGAPSARYDQLAVWTGKEMLIWGGSGSRGDGGRYDPATNTWTPMATAGGAGFDGAAVWDGAEMLVWGGGYGGNNAAYNPTANTWRSLPSSGAPSPRSHPAAVWTGSDMLLWGGGFDGTPAAEPRTDGAAYSPAANTWRPLPPLGATTVPSGARAVWTGREMLLWAGNGAAYDPAANTWRSLPTAGAPSPRCQFTPIWTGAAMLIWGGNAICNGLGAQALGDGAAYTPPVTTIPHDVRYFAQTGYRIDNDAIWDYFNRRGGVPTFGYPASRTFTLQGFTVQFFQRKIVQLDNAGHARLLNLLDSGLMPYASFNGSTFPGVDTSLVASSPDPTNQPATLAWVRQHAPDSVNGSPTNYYATFRNTVTAAVAFPTGGDASLLPGFDLEMWGVPTSNATVDPNNHNFIYLRWQRGVMHYDATCNCTQGILLADYFKDILTGRNLPADVAQESADSPFRDQYDPSAPNWVRDPSRLPDTNLTDAFVRD